ncbi:hypothetical protein ADK35_17810, partial [Streptomyces viridochromogenes]|uniref:hypothetical protein n=1 Tax=Streptomyces viridochromogenes TaxID=1938 RepID=UPI0006C41AE8
FLLPFTRNCTHRRWTASIAALAALNSGALTAYDDLAPGRVTAGRERRYKLAGLAAFEQVVVDLLARRAPSVKLRHERGPAGLGGEGEQTRLAGAGRLGDPAPC